MAGAGAHGVSAAPVIVTALFAPADFAWLETLRRAHFPATRNLVPAHLTLFQHLPPSIEDELDRRLRGETRGDNGPVASVAGLMKLAQGVAFRIESPGLEEVRARIADAFAPMLTPADIAPWRPHVTIQNKADPQAAAALHEILAEGFRPRPIGIAGLASWRYRGGPWEPIARYGFNRSGRSRRS